VLSELNASAVVCKNVSPELCQALHAVNIKVYSTFRCFYGEKLLELFPAAWPVTASGNPIEKENWYCGVNPASEDSCKHLSQEFKQHIKTMPVDGVWLDFMRWPCHWEVFQPKLIQTSFDATTTNRFFEETNITKPLQNASDYILNEYVDEWTIWKAHIITSFAKNLCTIKNTYAPTLTLGLFGVPWVDGEYEGALAKIIGQDYSALAKYIDVFTPMSYHHMCNRPAEWVSTVAKKVTNLTTKPVIPAVQCVDMPSQLPDNEYAALLRQLISNHTEIMIFELNDLIKKPQKLSLTKSVFQ
jgi:hypothetical protein